MEEDDGSEEIYYMDQPRQFWDERSNKKLDGVGVIAARCREIKQVHLHKVYVKVSIE